jgi:hypothetical protein
LKTWTQKISNGWIGVILIGFIYLLWIGIAVYFMVHYTKAEIENLLVRWIPWNLRINVLILLLVLTFCWPGIAVALKSFIGKSSPSGDETKEEGNSPVAQKRWISKINKKKWLLIALMIFAFVLVTFVTTRIHRIYFDEDIYANIGQNIALTNQTGMCNYGIFEYGEYFVHWLSYNKEPSGWPFLISLVFQMFGTNELYAFFMNNLIYLTGILVIFFITANMGGTYLQALLAALIFALTPHNVIWSNTIAAEPAAALFSGLVILCFFIYFKTDARRHLILLALLIPVACQMRAESGLIIIWGLAAMLMLSPKMFIKKEAWFAGLVAAIFLLPHFLHLYAVSGHSWGAENDKFSFAFLGKNLSTNAWYYFKNQQFPVIFTVFALVGLLLSAPPLRWRLMMLIWFVLFWGIFLFFYAGSYSYGADVRFALLSLMPLAIMGGMGGTTIVQWIRKAIKSTSMAVVLVIAVLMLCWIQFLPLIRLEGQEAWGARYDHIYAREFIKKIPKRSIVLTHIPTMFLLWGQNAIQTYAGINNPDIIRDLMEKYQGHVYFHCNYWCNTDKDINQSLCKGIRERYQLEAVATERQQKYEYGLYKMRFK